MVTVYVLISEKYNATYVGMALDALKDWRNIIKGKTGTQKPISHGKLFILKHILIGQLLELEKNI